MNESSKNTRSKRTGAFDMTLNEYVKSIETFGGNGKTYFTGTYNEVPFVYIVAFC